MVKYLELLLELILNILFKVITHTWTELVNPEHEAALLYVAAFVVLL